LKWADVFRRGESKRERESRRAAGRDAGSVIAQASRELSVGDSTTADVFLDPGEPIADPVDSILDKIGLRHDGEDLGEMRAACAKIARRLIKIGQLTPARVIGFVPAGDDVAVPPAMIQLALSLSNQTGAPTAVVDANVRYPGLSALASESNHGDTVYSTRWISQSVALLSPRDLKHAGEVVPQLARVVADGVDLFGHMLVDLTGFELIGEHASAAAGMDLVIVVARTHRTREPALLALAQVLPPDKFLGVVLVGS
jgi:hypothetical protein